jgi:CDP-glucose 4,6-dehydratase
VQDQAKNEIRSQYLSAALAHVVLGWQSLFTLDEGLQRTIEWYRTFFAADPVRSE